jgi:hypothetical protein
MPRSRKIEMYPSVWWDILAIMEQGTTPISLTFPSPAAAENKRQEFYAFGNALYKVRERRDIVKENQAQYAAAHKTIASYIARREDRTLIIECRDNTEANQHFAKELEKYNPPAKLDAAKDVAVDSLGDKALADLGFQATPEDIP